MLEVSPFARRQPVRRWEYETWILLAGPCSGREVGQWLTSATGSLLGIGFSLPPIHAQVMTEEQASHSLTTYAPLRWPFTEYDLTSTAGAMSTALTQAGFLIGQGGTPSFISIGLAANQLLFGMAEERDSGHPLILRVARTDAWIRHVHLTPTSVTVRTSGRLAPGSRLELLTTSEVSQSAVVDAKRKVSFVLPHGLPPGARLLLSRDGLWRDDRYLDFAYRLSQPDFTWESGDPATDIEALIAGGEDTTLEFKREVPTTAEARHSAMKTVAAFANGGGGVMLFGVENDGTVVGVSQAPRQRDTVSSLVHDSVVPTPEFEVRIVPAAKASLVLLRVRPGEDVPYAAHSRYYIRRAGTTFPAGPPEVRAAVLARQHPPASSLGFPSR